MQNIQKNPMVTVAEAAGALGIDERTVREKLSKGEWKGEKRLVGMKERWFIYRGELDRQIERLRVMRPQERVSTAGLDSVFESTVDDGVIDAQPIDEKAESEKVAASVDQVLSKLIEQFSKQLHAEKELAFALKRELEDKDRQLRLLPDLQKQAEERHKEAELKALEVEALRKQIEALEEKQTAAIEQERQAVLEAQRQAEESNTKAQEIAAEMERLRLEKETAMQEQLAALTRQLQELQKPKLSWWQKWFTSGEEQK
jgi:hypothetical protein